MPHSHGLKSNNTASAPRTPPQVKKDQTRRDERRESKTVIHYLSKHN